MTESTLICMTTANQVEYTSKALISIANAQITIPYEVLVIDDASEDGTADVCRALGVSVIQKPDSMGLTDSWNRAYRAFVDGKYKTLIIANNDILVPRGAIEELVAALESFALVGPLSSRNGVSHQPAQILTQNYPCPIDDEDPANVQLVQDFIQKQGRSNACVELPYLNGFFFAMSRQIIQFELPDGNLFDPGNVNTKNEEDLCRRLPQGKAVCLRAFIFHFKGKSFAYHKNLAGELVLSRNLTWKDAIKLRQAKPLLHRVLAMYSWYRRTSRWLRGKS